MKLKKIELKNNTMNKKAVLKIIEAFIAVMIVLGAVLVIMAGQKATVNKSDETIKLQKNILDYVSKDEGLRANALAGNRTYVQDSLRNLIPAGLNYRVNICPSNVSCPNPADYRAWQGKQVYSDKVLIAANLTYYKYGNLVQVKLFFWEGCGIGTGCEFLNDTLPVEVVEGPKSAILTLMFSDVVYSKVGANHTYTHTRTFKESNGVGVNLTVGKLCFDKPSYHCNSPGAVSYRIEGNGNLIQTAKRMITNYSLDNITLIYDGTDDNGNSISVSQKMCVNGSIILAENCN